jgi:hypothetical protein
VDKPKLLATQKISMSAIKGQANDDLCFDHQGITMTDRVPRRTSVAAACNCDWLQKLRRKMPKNLPDLLGDGPLILHDNARLHLGKVLTDLLSK